MEQVQHPVADGFHRNLCAFLLEEGEHLVIAVSFRLLRPEFADHLDHGLDPQPVGFHLNSAQRLAGLGQGFAERSAVKMRPELARRVGHAIGAGVGVAGEKGTHGPRRCFGELEARVGLQRAGYVFRHRFHRALRRAFMRLVRPQAAVQVVQQVSQDEGMQSIHSEIDVELEAAVPRCGLHAVVLLEAEDAEAIVSGCIQRGAELRFIHAEAAGAVGAGGEEQVVAHNLFARLGPLQPPQILNQVADREVRRIAKTIAAVFFADLVRQAIRLGKPLCFQSAAPQHRLDHAFVLPGEATEQNGDMAALGGLKGCFFRTQEMLSHCRQPGGKSARCFWACSQS